MTTSGSDTSPTWGSPAPTRGEGGKYLFLPPGYDGEVPDGYFVYRSPTFTNWAVLRALGGVPAMKQTKIYPLAEAADPEPNEFINLAELVFNTVHANDFSFYEEVDELVQEEPIEALDAERAGQLAAIGIEHGKPFAPDDRHARDPRTGGQDRCRDCRVSSPTPLGIPDASLYGSWKNAFVGGSYEFLRNGARLLDARTQFHYIATVITPRWPTPRSALAPPTPTPSTTPTATCSTAARPTGCTSTPTRRPRTSGPSTSTTPRPDR